MRDQGLPGGGRPDGGGPGDHRNSRPAGFGQQGGQGRENLGWFGLDDITPAQRREVRRIIAEHLVDDAEREFPVDMPGRPSALALLKDLAAMVSDHADG